MLPMVIMVCDSKRGDGLCGLWLMLPMVGVVYVANRVIIVANGGMVYVNIGGDGDCLCFQ